jgi:hypothetical protein
MPYPEGSIAAMRNIIRFTFIFMLFLGFSFGNCIVGNFSSVYAQYDWKQEYSDLCAKTQNAMVLSSEELKSYIGRCDKLLDHINKLEGAAAATEKKVYTKRVKMCRDLYDFALKYKEEKE